MKSLYYDHKKKKRKEDDTTWIEKLSQRVGGFLVNMSWKFMARLFFLGSRGFFSRFFKA